MKFHLQSKSVGKGRLGMLKDFERLPDLSLQTPAIMLYTKGGSVPNLSYEVLQLLTTDILGLQFPLSNTLHLAPQVKLYQKGLPSFVGLPEYLCYSTLRDGAVDTPGGFQEKFSMPVWSRMGKRLISADKFMGIMESYKPDMYVALHDGDTNSLSSKKRIYNSITNSEVLLKRCLEKHNASQVLKNKCIIAALEGGYDIRRRITYAKNCANIEEINGFLIDGLFTDGSKVENIEFEEISQVVRNTLEHLPTDKLRIIHGSWNPETILKLIKTGIDLFDSSHAYIATERGEAFTFQFDLSILDKEEIDTERKQNVPQSTPLPDKIDKEETDTDKESTTILRYSISLHDKIFVDDFSPIVEGCTCLTCTKHTRAYIHHLLVTKELLSGVLLMIHNLHHYLEFFRKIRNHLETNYV